MQVTNKKIALFGALALVAALAAAPVGSEARSKNVKKSKADPQTTTATKVSDPRKDADPLLSDPMAELPIRKLRVSLKSLGASRPLVLRGVDDDANVDLSVRLDELVEKAQLHLTMTLSPALIPALSHVKVFLNNEIVQTIALEKEKLGTRQTMDLALDARYFKDFNRLRFQFIGHYAPECELPYHSSLWAEISNESYIDLQLRQLPLANDLDLLPAPFFDNRDSNQLSLPFIYAAQPTLGLLKASGSIASWMGKLSAYRGSHFPVFFDALPPQHAIVFASNGQRPAFLKSVPLVDKPTISMVNHPDVPGKRLLLILGKDDAQVQIAADTLALEKAAFSGQTLRVETLEYPPLRTAYDAPKWISTTRPVTMGELVQYPGDLQLRGSRLNDVININTRMAPDLFTWNAAGVPVDLIYRYTSPSQTINGALNVLINDQFVKSYPLLASEGKLGSGVKDSMFLPLFDDGTIQTKSNLKIPAFLIGGDNRLQFAFQIPPADLGRCRSVDLVELRAAIDPMSTIDLTGFDHYIGMPNLTAYANSGFPFTKFADLAQTTVVLANPMSPADIELYLVALGRMGASTGYAGTRFELIQAADLEQAKNSDLLIISHGTGSAVSKWRNDLPALIEAAKKSIRPLTTSFDSFMGMFNDAPYVMKPTTGGKAILEGSGALAAMSGLESPLHRGRSVVLLEATDGNALKLITKVLNDPGKLPNVRGDLSLIRGESVESFRINSMYYLGDLPWWRKLWFQTHNYPLLLALLGIGTGFILTFMVYVALRTAARRRLSKRIG